MIKCISLIFLTLTIVTASSIYDDICVTCVPAVKCQVLGNITYGEQLIWLEHFQCRPSYDYGLASAFGTIKNVFVCCPNNILDFLNNPNVLNNEYTKSPGSQNNPSEGKAFDGQCAGLTSFPPSPDSECCGREATDDNRIASGSETELYQFPWTVLLTTIFNFVTHASAYNCGGTLISARYVLTAAHCVNQKGATVQSIKINLAEYDKRTFPTDCKISMGKRKCIQNMEMEAEQFIIHPQYVEETLSNDIALIRLRDNAPYTQFIRPICLPPFNMNQQKLQLAVAGWGRNGPYLSDIKQFTFVNLVSQRECGKFYAQLTTRQLCAVGYSGEDTCSGDSGGPLMTLYRGKYYVVGIVSGKRADTPCGTSVPSLFTNVYPYLDWINSNIMN